MVTFTRPSILWQWVPYLKGGYDKWRVGPWRVRGIVFAAYDRVFRPDRWTDLGILQIIANQGAHIYVPSGPIDLQTELGFVQASVNNLLAGLERRRIKERTLRAKDELRRQGKLASGRPPFGMGYDKAGGRWLYTDEIEDVKAIFRAFLSGEERSYARLGQRFGQNSTAIQTILRRPHYAGWLIYEPRGHGRGRGLKRWPAIVPDAPDSAIRVETGLPPAVAMDDFHEVQRIMEGRRDRLSLTRRSSTDAFLYRGMVACPCSLPIYGIGKRGRRGQPIHFYGCRSMKERTDTNCTNKHMLRDRVEIALDRVMAERLADPELIAGAVGAYNDSLTAAWRASVPSADADRRKRADLSRRRGRVLEAFSAGLITRPACDEQVAVVDAQLAAMPVAQRRGRHPALTTRDVHRLVRVLHRWPRLWQEGRREILEVLAPTFVLHRYRIEGVHLSVQNMGDSRRAPPAPRRS